MNFNTNLLRKKKQVNSHFLQCHKICLRPNREIISIIDIGNLMRNRLNKMNNQKNDTYLYKLNNNFNLNKKYLKLII